MAGVMAANPEALDKLARDLKLPAEVFAYFGVGFRAGRTFEEFGIPEQDGADTVIGVATRTYRYGHAVKKCLPESKRGLTVSAGWRDRPARCSSSRASPTPPP